MILNCLKKLPAVNQKFISRSLEFIEENAKIYIDQTTGGSNWYQLTGNLKNSFEKELLDNLGKLINNCYYSAYVEYGTGVVGNGTHPDSEGYVYDVNMHGDNGWWFFDDKGNMHWTKGMEAHRFLYNAINDYVDGEYKKIFDEVWKEEIGGIFK